ncbi:MAG: hypothetical protein NC938_05805 [Candidatus Omnitrophica bacterium]|nr:hypothetical protein [Candidatus Omnitrophota bacterium]MCM8791192.1 hypothetical protein [Candidatus Omnitrophota bacterium]
MILRIGVIFLAGIFLVFSFYGCDSCGWGPTYPKEKLEESIVRICKNEYKIDVKVHTVGKTIAIYLPLENLIDFSFALTKDASEKINNVILSVSRVVLSTDAKIDFYCIIAHDIRIPEIQVIIIKSVDDVKRLLLNDISRGEYGKRILIDMRMNPQSQKERSVKEIFHRMRLDPQWQEQVMNDFFRSDPTMLGDIGYWEGRFYVKDITKPEFLAEQMASRLKIDFKENKDLSDNFFLKSVKGAYLEKGSERYFSLEVFAEPRWFEDLESSSLTDKLLQAILNIAAHVMHVYKFEDFNYIEINERRSSRMVRISKGMLEDYRKKKIKFDEIVR